VSDTCLANRVSEPLPSNGRPLRHHHSGFQPSCHNIKGTFTPTCVPYSWEIYITCRHRHTVPSHAGLERNGEKAEEVNTMKIYVTNDEASCCTLNGCLTTYYKVRYLKVLSTILSNNTRESTVISREYIPKIANVGGLQTGVKWAQS
jgi:hypothetical protein